MSGDPASATVAVVVPVHNRRAVTLGFLERTLGILPIGTTIVIIDDGSSDGTAEAIRASYPLVVVLSGDGSLWWAGATNRGVEYALQEGFDYVLTINDDSLPEPGFLKRLQETSVLHDNAIVGAMLVDHHRPQSVWACGGEMRYWNGELFRHHFCGRSVDEARSGGRVHAVDILPGCGVLVPTAVFRAIGLYDNRYCPQYHADSEFTLRAKRAGYEVVVDTSAVIANDTSQTARWRGWWAAVCYRGSPSYFPAIYRILQYAPSPLAAAIALPTYYARVIVDRLLQVLGVRPGRH